jgi:hypothetical protein
MGHAQPTMVRPGRRAVITTSMHSKKHPYYTFITAKPVLVVPHPSRFSMTVRIRKGHPGMLVQLELNELFAFDSGLLCQLVSIDQFSYNGRTATISVECLAHIAP